VRFALSIVVLVLTIVFSGTGNEKENMATEKEYENAVAKGWRPCECCLEYRAILIE